MNEIIEKAVAMVATLLRPIDARAVDNTAVHDWWRNVSWYTGTLFITVGMRFVTNKVKTKEDEFIMPVSKAPVCNNGITQFYLPPTHKPYLPLLPSRKASEPFGWYSLCPPTKGWVGWVDLGGWLHTERNVAHRELNPDTVTHPSTNRARRR